MARVRLTSEERREHLLDVAATVIVQRGREALTMERLAATSGVSKALPYQHFGNAEDVVEALRRREGAIIGARIAKAVEAASDGTIEEVVGAGVHAYFDVLVERGTLLAVLAASRRTTDDGVSGRDFMADIFMKVADLDRRRAELAASIALGGLPGAVDAWVERRASRREVERALTLMIAGGLSRLAGE